MELFTLERVSDFTRYAISNKANYMVFRSGYCIIY